jgi:alpha-beta hydrolase superfamily lysophospholipase
VPPQRLLYYGESLGAAVVTELATEHPPAGLLLRSPFVDLAAVGHVHYPFLPVRALLWRVRWTPPQAGLSPAARRRNVRDAFAVPPWVGAAARRQHLEGRVLVLVDDVMTTAATLDGPELVAAVVELAQR